MNQSGIQLPQSVCDVFHERRLDARWFQLVFSQESIELTQEHPMGDIASDFDAMAQHVTDSPSYFVFKLDPQEDTSKHEYILVLYVPDNSKVKTKMLMSSTADTIKSNLGYQFFVGTYHTTQKKELQYSEFKASWTPKHEAYKFHDVLLTDKERQQLEEKSMQHFEGPSKSNVKGLNFPLDPLAEEALQQYANNELNLVTLKIENESLLLDAKAEDYSADELAEVLVPNEPRFCFFKYRHEFDDKLIESLFMIYSCPTATKVKNRMIYSASKSSVQSLAADLGVFVEKSVEVSDLADLNSSFLHDLIHGSAAVLGSKETFSKPKRPVGRAGARTAKK